MMMMMMTMMTKEASSLYILP